MEWVYQAEAAQTEKEKADFRAKLLRQRKRKRKQISEPYCGSSDPDRPRGKKKRRENATNAACIQCIRSAQSIQDSNIQRHKQFVTMGVFVSGNTVSPLTKTAIVT